MRKISAFMSILVLLITSCSKDDDTTTSGTTAATATYKTAKDMEDMLNHPGVYEINYFYENKLYTVDLEVQKYKKVAPVKGIKDYDEFMIAVSDKNLSIIEDKEHFGTIILLNNRENSYQKFEEVYNKVFPPDSNTIIKDEEPFKDLPGATDLLRVSSGKANNFLRKSHSYVTLFEEINLEGTEFPLQYKYGNLSKEAVYDNARIVPYPNFHAFNNKASSMLINFKDNIPFGLGVPKITVQLFENGDFGGASYYVVYKRTSGITQKINSFFDMYIWRWWIYGQNWNDKASCAKLIFHTDDYK